MKQLIQKLKKIKFTRRMIIIWVVSVTAVLVVGFGSVAFGLSMARYNFGKSISYSNVLTVDFKNENESGQLSVTSTALPIKINKLQNIIGLINKSGKTNKMEQLFKTTDEHVTYENKLTQTSTFVANQKQHIVIRFNQPQFSIADTETRNRYAIVNADADNANSSRLIHEVLIPLDRTQNKIQEQIWYLVIQDPDSSSSRTISYKFVTYGNYYELGNEIRDLRLHC